MIFLFGWLALSSTLLKYRSNKKVAANPYRPTEPWHPFESLVVLRHHELVAYRMDPKQRLAPSQRKTPRISNARRHCKLVVCFFFQVRFTGQFSSFSFCTVGLVVHPPNWVRLAYTRQRGVARNLRAKLFPGPTNGQPLVAAKSRQTVAFCSIAEKV